MARMEATKGIELHIQHELEVERMTEERQTVHRLIYRLCEDEEITVMGVSKIPRMEELV